MTYASISIYKRNELGVARVLGAVSTAMCAVADVLPKHSGCFIITIDVSALAVTLQFEEFLVELPTACALYFVA